MQIFDASEHPIICRWKRREECLFGFLQRPGSTIAAHVQHIKVKVDMYGPATGKQVLFAAIILSQFNNIKRLDLQDLTFPNLADPTKFQLDRVCSLPTFQTLTLGDVVFTSIEDLFGLFPRQLLRLSVNDQFQVSSFDWLVDNPSLPPHEVSIKELKFQ